MKEILYTFKGVEGIVGEVQGPNVKSATAAAMALIKYQIISFSGDNGALNIWKTKAGYHCEFYRYMATKDSQIYKTKKLAMAWFKEWSPKVWH